MHYSSLAWIALAGGCATQTPASTTSPHVAVKLTDAPGAFEAVWVNISTVEIESQDAGWIPLASAPQTFDLLKLQNDVTAALGGATLDAGAYGQLRLIVDSASVVVDGVESPMTIASGSQTGIKVPLDQTIEDGMTYTVTLDYDAAQSIKSTNQGYRMVPVIRVKELVATPAMPPVM